MLSFPAVDRVGSLPRKMYVSQLVKGDLLLPLLGLRLCKSCQLGDAVLAKFTPVFWERGPTVPGLRQVRLERVAPRKHGGVWCEQVG